MVKATFEYNGDTVVHTGDAVIGMVLETLSDGTGVHIAILGESSSKAVARALAEGIPDIIERVADDPIDVATVMVCVNRMLEKRTKAYLAGHADEIAGAMRDYAKGLADE